MEQYNDIKFFWFIPSHGDGRYLGSATGGRAINLPYLQQMALAADSLGYYGVLLPTGKSCEDAWVVASSLISITKNLRFLVALRPGLQPPTLAARMTATLERLSAGRLLINIVTGGDPVENKGDGIFLSHSDRYKVTEEFLQVYLPLIKGEKVTFKGEFIQVEDAEILFPLTEPDKLKLFFGGSSDAAHDITAKYIDTYLSWGEPLSLVQEKLDVVSQLSASYARQLDYGIRFHVIVRETEEEAWAAADRLISHLDDETIASAQSMLSRLDSVGQSRMRSLHNGSRESLRIAPNLWAGVGLVRTGAGTALVGSPQQIADRIKEYRALGFTKFILSGYPHLEEAHYFAELVMPLFADNQPSNAKDGIAETQHSFANAGPVGEIIGGHKHPGR
ncbi:alkanesulfonate monooxygenase, FMNH-dependent [Xenorhabdus mauleonii]|uniref:alkanesulfonate monooxygenase n=1 Tax=Xenorhabdus mauleonii TaxID=351675 RepID=A0A1I3IGY7_9GAMM|nr:FMNH2-dependent alkanesulfonate monooxygenase [Xenorhabdus mauleonii]PHM39498.1 alkanesulfonate monooxygenase, FMNH-dependent [Xenorhabdus mauleonii]SFI47191.1 alkanesulfonate monooxygenase [Xenorhabdus mauleonii]